MNKAKEYWRTREYRTPEKPKDISHSPDYQYHCERCKFSWNCGYLCSCIYQHTLPEPPMQVKRAVNEELKRCGYYPQFNLGRTKGQRR